VQISPELGRLCVSTFAGSKALGSSINFRSKKHRSRASLLFHTQKRFEWNLFGGILHGSFDFCFRCVLIDQKKCPKDNRTLVREREKRFIKKIASVPEKKLSRETSKDISWSLEKFND